LGNLCFSESIAPEFLFWFFNCVFFRGELARTCTGMKVRHTSPDRILRVPFPVPPLSEQKRIVSKVTELMSLCDALEAKLTQAESASSQLLSAVVHHLITGANPNA
ncbi:MAG: restriction endonuclease subunit S, partial [Pirellula sp.]|nr:restriction endonuclease subunit S [Pirellula sp.]